MEAVAAEGLSQERSFIHVPCLICGGEQADVIVSAADIEVQFDLLRDFHQQRHIETQPEDLTDRSAFTQDYATQVVQCRGCGFVYKNPRPAIPAVTSTYSKDHYTEAHLHSEFASQRKWAEDKASDLVPWFFGNAKPSIVEVGSFVGGFLAAGQKRGWRMLGVDPGQQVTDFCRARGLPVYCGTLGDAPVVDGSVDAVAIWNTFDQLPNPDTTLAAARRILRSRGLLVIRVPNGLLYRRAVGLLTRTGVVRKTVIALLAWNNLLGFPYLNGYSVSTLDQLARRHGFRRRKVRFDTLVPLADQKTKLWASWEERAVKWGCRRFAARPSRAPWLDLYYGLEMTGG